MPEPVENPVPSPRLGIPERTGLAMAVLSMAPSLQRGLLPRSLAQQAGLTGFMGAFNYGTVTTLQAAIESVSTRLVGQDRSPTARRGAMLAGNLAVVGTGLGAQRLLAARKDESVLRAALRAWAWRSTVGATVGAVTVLLDESAVRVRGEGARAVGVPITLAVAAGTASGLYWRYRRRLVEEGAEVDALGQPVGDRASTAVLKATGVGVGATALFYAVAKAETLAAAGIGAGVGAVAPDLRPFGKAIGHAVMLGGLGYGVLQALNHVDAMTEKAGVAVEAAHSPHATSPNVTAGPNSLIDGETIGREGRRFVNMVLSAADIERVMGEPASDPVRAFVGLDTVATSAERADLAIRELDTLGAFERSTLALFSPTGTGYVNYVACESLEYLTRGDVASVALQYSVLPSFLSLDRVKVGQENTRAFLTALKWRLQAMPEAQRPRVVMFGESLGSHVGEDSLALPDGQYGHELYGVDRVLFIGSPWGSGWRRRWLADPHAVDPAGLVVEVATFEEWEALPQQKRDAARIVLLSHHDDPIPKFGPPLAVQAPDWLGPAETRAPGVPHEVRWSPINTFLSTFLDVLNADQGKPGQFEARGHDYKSDLVRFTRLAWDLDATPEQMSSIEDAVRARELEWAERRLQADTAAKAEAKVREQLAQWGVDTAAVPPVLSVAGAQGA